MILLHSITDFFKLKNYIWFKYIYIKFIQIDFQFGIV